MKTIRKRKKCSNSLVNFNDFIHFLADNFKDLEQKFSSMMSESNTEISEMPNKNNINITNPNLNNVNTTITSNNSEVKAETKASNPFVDTFRDMGSSSGNGMSNIL